MDLATENVKFYEPSSKMKREKSRMVTAFVLMRIGTGEQLDFERVVKEQIKKVEGVKEAYTVFGRYDLVARVEAPNLEELSHLTDKIRAIAGVLSTESLLVHS